MIKIKDKEQPTKQERNDEHLKKFLQQLEGVSEQTIKDYNAKLTQMKKQIDFEDSEEKLLQFLSIIENPNTRSNKAFALIRMRRFLNLDVGELESMREDLKGEIRMHRKEMSKVNNDSLITYEELQQQLDKLEGRDFIMNYMYANHGVRNQDINMKYVARKPNKPVSENTLYQNKNAKHPCTQMHIVDYKTASTYGPKTITVKDQRLFDEINKLGLKNNQYIFGCKDGSKPTLNYMNVLAKKKTINNYGEGRIAKILVKHYIDTKQFEKIEELSQARGTAMSTLYTTYNVMDNK